jgi:hypothetical protein
MGLPSLQDRLPTQRSQLHQTRLLNLFEAQGLAARAQRSFWVFGVSWEKSSVNGHGKSSLGKC